MIVDNKTTGSVERETLSFLDGRILREKRKKSRCRLLFEAIITVVIIFILFGVIAGIGIVQGDSMKPNLTNGSMALFYRLGSTYKKNDIVIFKSSGVDKLLIKRVVAVAGDTVDIDEKTGNLLINGVVQKNDTSIGGTYKREGGVTFPIRVPKGYVFVMGDNREVALDSRYFGTIYTKNLIGKVLFEIKLLNS